VRPGDAFAGIEFRLGEGHVEAPGIGRVGHRLALLSGQLGPLPVRWWRGFAAVEYPDRGTVMHLSVPILVMCHDPDPPSVHFPDEFSLVTTRRVGLATVR
jgi:hypothetical protein